MTLVLSNALDNHIWNVSYIYIYIYIYMVIIFSDNCNLLLPVSFFVVLTSPT